MKTYITVFLLVFTSMASAQWVFTGNPDINYPCNFVTVANGKLYLGHNQGVYESTDDGETWTSLTNGFAASSSSSFREIVVKGSNIFVASTNFLYNSKDGGVTWGIDTSGMNLPLGFSIGEVHTIYSDGEIVLASVMSTGYQPRLYRRNINETTWELINGITYVKGIVKIDNTLYAATYNNGVYASADKGLTWTLKGNSGYPKNYVNVWAGSILVTHDNTLFLASEIGIFRSINEGDSWIRIDKNFVTGTPVVRAIYSDGANLYTTVWLENVAYTSSDNGENWVDISVGLDSDSYLTSFTSHNGTIFGSLNWGSNGVVKYMGGSTDVETLSSDIPSDFSLLQNYPNPFNPATNIEFQISQTENVSLKIYNSLGEEVATLLNEVLSPGSYKINFNAESLSSGVYIYQLTSGNLIQTQKMTLIK
jgi:hypothetical protein